MSVEANQQMFSSNLHVAVRVMLSVVAMMEVVFVMMSVVMLMLALAPLCRLKALLLKRLSKKLS